MYYEERCIDGVWQFRTTPGGTWRFGRLEQDTPAPVSAGASGVTEAGLIAEWRERARLPCFSAQEQAAYNACADALTAALTRAPATDACLRHLDGHQPGCAKCCELAAPQGDAIAEASLLALRRQEVEDVLGEVLDDHDEQLSASAWDDIVDRLSQAPPLAATAGLPVRGAQGVRDAATWALIAEAVAAGAERDEADNGQWWTMEYSAFANLAARLATRPPAAATPSAGDGECQDGKSVVRTDRSFDPHAR